MSSRNAMGAQNILGPLLKRLRVEAGLSHFQVAARFTDYGCKCTPEHIARIEEQQDSICDFELVIIEKIFPGHSAEIIKLIAQHAAAETQQSR